MGHGSGGTAFTSVKPAAIAEVVVINNDGGISFTNVDLQQSLANGGSHNLKGGLPSSGSAFSVPGLLIQKAPMQSHTGEGLKSDEQLHSKSNDSERNQRQPNEGNSNCKSF